MNVYEQLIGIIPRSRLIIAVVQLDHGDGSTSAVTLDGYVMRVRGGGRAAGARVFIAIDPALGTSIVGDAPSLPSFSIEV